MQKRLVLSFVGVVVIGLLIAGLGTFLQAGLDRSQHTQKELIDTARSTTAFLSDSLGDRRPLSRERVKTITEISKVNEYGIIIFNPASRQQTILSDLPTGVEPKELDFEVLAERGYLSGTKDGRVWVAALAEEKLDNGALAVVVLSDEFDDVLGEADRWFLFAAIFAVCLAAIVATWLGKRFSRPVIDAARTARSLASGDLSARLPELPKGSSEETSDLVLAINSMAESMERARGVERQFLLSVSHDLRTPMTSIQGYAEAIIDEATDDPQHAGRVILAESRRLDRLVSDLLELARLDAQHFTLVLSHVDLIDIARKSADGLRLSASKMKVDLVVASPPEPLLIEGDPDRIGQVISNLLENAIRYANTKIVLNVRSLDDGIELSVTDDGPGISTEDLPHVFERLYVSRHQPLERESGSGLGLAIVKELVTAMGGEVQIFSTLGSGTTIKVIFPKIN